MTKNQLVLIKKDVRGVIANKRVLASLLIVPLVLTIVLPSVFVIGSVLEPETISDFQILLDMLPNTSGKTEQELILGLVINKIMPIFFLMIPIMTSSVMAASSFVGEKEKQTLETLLYSPLSLKQVFQAKILAAFFIGFMISFISFVAMMLVVEIEIFVLTGAILIPDFTWLIIMLLVSPAISLAGIAITVKGSAKAQTIEESQQRAVFLVFPLIALAVGQFSGIILLNSWLMIVFGAVLAVVDFVIMRGAARNFTYEKILK